MYMYMYIHTHTWYCFNVHMDKKEVGKIICHTHDSMSTDSWLIVEGEGVGSSPGPITLIENFKYPLAPAEGSSGSVKRSHL